MWCGCSPARHRCVAEYVDKSRVVRLEVRPGRLTTVTIIVLDDTVSYGEGKYGSNGHAQGGATATPQCPLNRNVLGL